jgi:hypothetical protein
VQLCEGQTDKVTDKDKFKNTPSREKQGKAARSGCGSLQTRRGGEGRGDEGLTVVALMYGGIPASTNGYAHEFALPVGTIGEGCDAIAWVCPPPPVPGAVQNEITLLGVVRPPCERFAPGFPP